MGFIIKYGKLDKISVCIGFTSAPSTPEIRNHFFKCVADFFGL